MLLGENTHKHQRWLALAVGVAVVSVSHATNAPPHLRQAGVPRATKTFLPARNPLGVRGGQRFHPTLTTQELVHTVMLEGARQPIIQQYDASSHWDVMMRWTGTVMQTTWRKVTFYVGFTYILYYLFHHPRVAVKWLGDEATLVVKLKGQLDVLDHVWKTLNTITTFTLSFYLNTAFGMWREMYKHARKVQGRLNDIMLLAVTHAKRDRRTGELTRESAAVLETLARYERLWQYLFYACWSPGTAPLMTDEGIASLAAAGACTPAEAAALTSADLPPTARYNCALVWMESLFVRAVEAGVFIGTERSALSMMMLKSLHELRGTAASVGDEIDGRMPVACECCKSGGYRDSNCLSPTHSLTRSLPSDGRTSCRKRGRYRDSNRRSPTLSLTRSLPSDGRASCRKSGGGRRDSNHLPPRSRARSFCPVRRAPRAHARPHAAHPHAVRLPRRVRPARRRRRVLPLVVLRRPARARQRLLGPVRGLARGRVSPRDVHPGDQRGLGALDARRGRRARFPRAVRSDPAVSKPPLSKDKREPSSGARVLGYCPGASGASGGVVAVLT